MHWCTNTRTCQQYSCWIKRIEKCSQIYCLLIQQNNKLKLHNFDSFPLQEGQTLSSVGLYWKYSYSLYKQTCFKLSSCEMCWLYYFYYFHVSVWQDKKLFWFVASKLGRYILHCFSTKYMYNTKYTNWQCFLLSNWFSSILPLISLSVICCIFCTLHICRQKPELVAK